MVMNVHHQGERLAVTEIEAAALLAVSPSTLRAWRSQSRGPRFSRLGRRVVYRLRDLEGFLSANAEEAGRS
jgi:hypothetical protein